MTAKEYLRQYEKAHKRAMRCREEYENESVSIDAIKSLSNVDGMPHGSGISKPTEEKAIRLADKRLRLIDAELEALRVKQEVFDMVNGIEGDIGDILFERYINLRKWEEICILVHLSWRQVHRLHAKGLSIVENKMA